MGTISGSVVEPATPYYPPEYQKQQKQNKILLLATIIEAVVIVGLVIFLLIVAVVPLGTDNVSELNGEEAGSGGEDYENYASTLDESESTTLKYLYALANNQTLNISQAPYAVCNTISDLYNKFSTDGSVLTDPCVNGQIVLATDMVDSEYYPNPILYKFSVVHEGKAYNLYAHLNLLSFSYVDLSYNLPENSTIIKINE